MEKAPTEVQSGGAILHSKLKTANSATDVNTIVTFQDGGRQNMHLDRTSNEYSQNMDSNVMNPDVPGFGQGGGDQSVSNEGIKKMNENVSVSQMNSYNVGFNRGNFNAVAETQQHGGMGNANAGSGDFVQQNRPNQFLGANMGPPYPQKTRMPSNLPNRTGMVCGDTGMIPGNYNTSVPVGQQGSQSQRVMSGPGIQQQAGPTPTLNQLLQNQKYQGGYGDYVGPQKEGVDPGMNSPGFGVAPTGWTSQQRPMNPYDHQGNQYRNQVCLYLIYYVYDG